MNLQKRNKVDSAFNMASMTDLIFLLLIFFMLTSSFVTPSGLPVNLPTSKASTIEVQKVSVTVTKDLQYFINEKKVTRNSIETELKKELSGTKGVVILHIDESVPTKELVFVASIATSLEAKVSIATKPK
ncbi:MAG: biopolymer transporter ExbD [Cytophagales bacterium]|jgi:biopolymer transport protein ExbD|nr:biopolymer transporter ExbD [Cytophagales bacterium]MCA6387587.1 biopolymer transporter ExbD [Cytophagales bacterium]MCA6390293.1 biopolymer transporter ExbD [Cytophagales bacterium]MCA6394382.1 biopolymer transporter ExbD [Cytophagales bacterium]MCA6399372.1 biopolymer transporter ExbD [Cytophagales bacterium]